jgi:hypothetical protein
MYNKALLCNKESYAAGFLITAVTTHDAHLRAVVNAAKGTSYFAPCQLGEGHSELVFFFSNLDWRVGSALKGRRAAHVSAGVLKKSCS